jgi:hypothetical protein
MLMNWSIGSNICIFLFWLLYSYFLFLFIYFDMIQLNCKSWGAVQDWKALYRDILSIRVPVEKIRHSLHPVHITLYGVSLLTSQLQ